jgi:deoxyribodipyrimidine photo-lyase
MPPPINIFWFRRDLRLEDNAGLFHALRAGLPVVPLFIFDSLILDELDNPDDRRVGFIHQVISTIQQQLISLGSTMEVRYGQPVEIFQELTKEYNIQSVFTNHDYEPYAIQRDDQIREKLHQRNIGFHTCKDQVIFEKDEVVKDNGLPYGVFTPYSKKWRTLLTPDHLKPFHSGKLVKSFHPQKPKGIPSLEEMGFNPSNESYPLPQVDPSIISNYENTRDHPSLPTSRLGMHLRFGTISVRQVARHASTSNTFLGELVWREFFMQLLWHHPRVVQGSFKPEYDRIAWRNNEADFEKWKTGQTGFPIVDAGMRELKQTGFMHNRVRMITASFLVKHLLIDWRWGEAWFASNLMDYELASNNGNWQWVAGCGCDAAPYFRVFNPHLQAKKFDPQMIYIRKWVPEVDSLSYRPIILHEGARDRCLKVYKAALKPSGE